jgi:hypothetical protein
VVMMGRFLLAFLPEQAEAAAALGIELPETTHSSRRNPPTRCFWRPGCSAGFCSQAVHERRRPSELHGERPVVYGSQGPGPEEAVGVLDAESHYLLAPAFYNEVFLKALAGRHA